MQRQDRHPGDTPPSDAPSTLIPIYLALNADRHVDSLLVDIDEIQHVEPICYGDYFVLRVRRYDGITFESNRFKECRIVTRFAKLIDEVKQGHRSVKEAADFLYRHVGTTPKPERWSPFLM